MLDPEPRFNNCSKAEFRSYLWQGDCPLLAFINPRIGFEHVAQLKFQGPLQSCCKHQNPPPAVANVNVTKGGKGCALRQMGWLGDVQAYGLAWGPGREEIPTHDNKYQQCAPDGLDTQAYIHVCDRICMNVEVSKNKSGSQNKSQLISILQAYKCLVSSCPSLQTKLKCLSSDIFLAFHPGTCQLSRGCMASHRLSHRNFEVLSLTSRVGQPQEVTKLFIFSTKMGHTKKNKVVQRFLCVRVTLARGVTIRKSPGTQEVSPAPNCQAAGNSLQPKDDLTTGAASGRTVGLKNRPDKSLAGVIIAPIWSQ